VDLWFDDSHTLEDPGRYRRLVGKLIYLTVTRPDITFVVEVLSRFMHQPKETHWLAVMRVLTYIKSYPGKRLMYKKHGRVHISRYSDSGYARDREDKKSTTDYCTFVGGDLMS